MIKISIMSMVIFCLFISCSEEPLKPNIEHIPEIVSVSLPDRWNLNATDSSIVEIKVTDPQGASDLLAATMQVFNASASLIFSGELYDDGGISGSTDVLAGDGVFRNLYVGSQIVSESGSYDFTFIVSDKAGNETEAFRKTVTFGLNQAPRIISTTELALLESGADPVIINVIAEDEDSAQEDVSVFMDLLFNNTSIFNEPIQLANDGNLADNGDTFAADSIYALKIDSSFAAAKQGAYTMVFSATDEFDDKSNVFQNEILIENSKPIISGLNAPQTISRPTGPGELNTALITLDVHDSQSLADIDSVYFNSLKPDSTAAQGNPFILLDNGIPFDINNFETAKGDQTANDGTYSITIVINNQNDRGTYEFTFFARDKAGNLSESITHYIEVQ